MVNIYYVWSTCSIHPRCRGNKNFCQGGEVNLPFLGDSMTEEVISQGEFEGVLPEDLRRRTDSNKIWRTILAQNYLKQNLAHDFSAAFNNLITVLQENIKQ